LILLIYINYTVNNLKPHAFSFRGQKTQKYNKMTQDINRSVKD